MRFVIDEDMPRSLGPALASAGHEVLDVRDRGLRGRTDDEVFRYAQDQAAALISEDLGFANLLRFPLGTHHGIVVPRFSTSVPPKIVVEGTVRALAGLAPADIRGALIIVEPHQVRIRQPQ